ncbi:hypothetical protein Echvi_4248 [Echinicola vietnamensis DSM 17526]|uniref:Uncharacterized protein n=1 Tax=Echinicola vietnamensis (strain DSM 17526 / LMG 23754 / KMM 6221) TaxID=926556 RepID=L0G546_ECHVK|nr:hypothetical protein Echvi_4248 [Echinicola vietnamensis DSM 17526]
MLDILRTTDFFLKMFWKVPRWLELVKGKMERLNDFFKVYTKDECRIMRFYW